MVHLINEQVLAKRSQFEDVEVEGRRPADGYTDQIASSRRAGRIASPER
jgi:hypothetical protein